MKNFCIFFFLLKSPPPQKKKIYSSSQIFKSKSVMVSLVCKGTVRQNFCSITHGGMIQLINVAHLLPNNFFLVRWGVTSKKNPNIELMHLCYMDQHISHFLAPNPRFDRICIGNYITTWQNFIPQFLKKIDIDNIHF